MPNEKNDSFAEFLSRAEEDYDAEHGAETDYGVTVDNNDSESGDGSVTDELVEKAEDSEIETIADEETSKREKMITAGKLYDIILRHPDWRVVEVSGMGADYCHPLKYRYSDGHLLFQYDGTGRQYHYEGACEDIIDLNGSEPFNDDRANKKVYILQDLFCDEWDWDDSGIKQVRKATLDASAKWIKLHPED